MSTDNLEYEYAAQNCGWHKTERGTWMADDQSAETGYPGVEYMSAKELCENEGIEPYDHSDMNEYVISETVPCYVTFRRVVLAHNESDAIHAYTQDQFSPNDNIKPEIGDVVDGVPEKGTELEGEYDPSKYFDPEPRAPASCPHCESIDIHCSKAEPDGLTDQVVGNECQNCGTTWKELYKFKKIIYDP